MKYFKIIRSENNNKILFNEFVNDKEAIKELIESRIKIIKGELKYNIKLGIPIGYNKTEIDLQISNIILSTSGVEKILKFESKIDYNRRYIANIYIQTQYSGIINIVV